MDVATALQVAKGQLENRDFAPAEALLSAVIRSAGPNGPGIAEGWPQLFREGRGAPLQAQVRQLLSNEPENVAAQALSLFTDALAAKGEAILGADAADAQKRVRLFEDKSDEFLNIVLNIPITTCNYRCEYCFLNHELKPDVSKLEQLDAIIERLARIPRPLGVTLSPAGEVLAVPKMWPYFSKLAALPNVVWIEIWSNLSREPEQLFQYVPPDRLCVIGTYHPTEFKSFDRDNELFFARVERLKKAARDISINFVIYEKNLPYVDALKERLGRLGVHLTFNPQIHPQNGYGVAITPITQGQEAIARDLLQNEFLDFFFLQNKKADVRCTAGRDMLDIGWDGRVTRCEHLAKSNAPVEDLGNILDPEGPMVDRASRFCSLGGCACKSTIGYAEPFVARYKRVGTQHRFIRRPDGEVGTHSYDPVALPLKPAGERS